MSRNYMILLHIYYWYTLYILHAMINIHRSEWLTAFCSKARKSCFELPSRSLTCGIEPKVLEKLCWLISFVFLFSFGIFSKKTCTKTRKWRRKRSTQVSSILPSRFRLILQNSWKYIRTSWISGFRLKITNIFIVYSCHSTFATWKCRPFDGCKKNTSLTCAETILPWPRLCPRTTWKVWWPRITTLTVIWRRKSWQPRRFPFLCYWSLFFCFQFFSFLFFLIWTIIILWKLVLKNVARFIGRNLDWHGINLLVFLLII